MRRSLTRAAGFEALLIVVLFVVAAWWGSRYVTRFVESGRRPFFYQNYFEPAVMLACGRGFVVAQERPQALDDFLFQRSDTFDCASVASPLMAGPEGVYQYGWYYLMLSVGLAWKVLGVSWSGLAPYFGLLFGTVIVLAYALFRLAAPPALALAPALALTASSLHLQNLPHLRDYAKAPFVLALILLMAWLVRRPMRRAALLGVAALYGAVLGVGYGFRSDLLANIPPFVVAMLLFLPGGVTRNIGIKAAALVLAVATFAVTAWPVATFVAARGGCQWHVALLGLDSRFTDDLGVAPSFYQWHNNYSDEYIATTAGSYQNRTRALGPMEYCSAEYDAATGAYFRDIVRRVPGDVVTRAYASVLRILDLPLYWWGAASAGVDESSFSARGRLLRYAAGGVTLAALVSVAALGAHSTRIGTFALLFVLYFGGYPSIQFSNRHFFHLEFIGWWAMTFLLWQAARSWRHRGDARELVQCPDWRVFGTRAVRFAAVAGVLVMLPVPLLRAYQDREVEVMTLGLLNAPREPVAVAAAADGFLKLTTTTSPQDAMRTDYLDVHLDRASCPDGFGLGLRYAAPDPFYDFSGPVRFVPAGTSPERVLVPVYRYFDGLTLTGAPGACVSRVERVTLGPQLSVLPVLTLPPDWQDGPLHQALKPSRWVKPLRWMAGQR